MVNSKIKIQNSKFKNQKSKFTIHHSKFKIIYCTSEHTQFLFFSFFFDYPDGGLLFFGVKGSVA